MLHVVSEDPSNQMIPTEWVYFTMIKKAMARFEISLRKAMCYLLVTYWRNLEGRHNQPVTI